MSSQLRIAHISDLHYPHWDDTTFDNLKNYLKQKRPDVILVTGDLADQPWPWSHSNVKTKLLELKSECENGNCSTKLSVIPGNHDFAFFGNWNLGTSLIWMFSFARIFKGYRDDFFQLASEDLNVYFFCFNSNPFVARWAKGLVSRRQLKWLQRKVAELRRENSVAFDSGYKVAVLHHHPLPIPHSEELERFLMLKNAGEVLRVFAQCRIDLVLHGHKHDSVVSSVNLGTAYGANVGQAEATRRMFIVASGSTLKRGVSENALNIITINERRQAEVLPVRAWPGSDFAEKEPVPIPSWDDYIQERYRTETKRLGYEIDEFRKYMVIDEEGDGFTDTDFVGIRVLNQSAYQKAKDTEIDPFELYTETGRIQVLPPSSGQRPPVIISQVPNKITGKLDLPDYIDPQRPPSINFRVLTLNAWALNDEEFQRRYFGRFGPLAYEEEWIVPRRPVKVLRETIVLPAKCKPERPPELMIYAPYGNGFAAQPDASLGKYFESALVYDERRNAILLNLKQPLIGHKYVLRWLLPPASTQSINQKYIGEADAFVDRLASEEMRVEIEFVTRAAEQLLREKVASKAGERTDVALAIPKHKPNRIPMLRVVADNQVSSTAENLEIEVGDGIPGRAFRLNELIFYVDQPVSRNPKHVYVPFGRVHQHKVLYAVPVRHPMEQALVVGVLTIGSPDGFSSLIPESKQAEGFVIKSLIDIVQEYVVKSLNQKVGDILSLPTQGKR